MEPITLIPAERHLPTASGTVARGGSIMEMRPRKESCSVGKFMSSQSKVYPRGNWDEDRFKWQKPVRDKGSVRFRTELRRNNLFCFSDINDQVVKHFRKKKN